jgi:hypothetical protein
VLGLRTNKAVPRIHVSIASTVAISSALHPEGSYPAIATLFLTVPATLLFGSSATYGYLARSHCGRMREELHREQTARH